jgi:GDP-L-fucose synthase
MNIFITGANGFIGSHLKEYLCSKYTFYHIFSPSSQELNLSNELDVERYIKQNRIDIIVHLANKGGGRDTIDMKNITEYNLRIFFNILKHEKNVQKIISFGSGAEYGKHKPIIDAKEDEYLKELPLDEYGFYKLITSRHIEKCDNIVQLRLFGVYGEYENYLYKFISNAVVKNLLHMPIVIGKNVFFDYLYVKDLLKMIDYFLHNKTQHKIYNASKGEKIDLISLANIINEVGEYKSEITVLNDGLNNEYTSNNQRILRELKNFCFTSNEEAISNLYEYFAKNLKNIDVESIKKDSYLKNIDKIWKVK